MLMVLNNIIKEYEGCKVLSINRLELQENRFYSVIGPNGAGKSTLLKILDLLEPPTSGSYTLMGTDVLRAGEYARLQLRRQMNMVFQSTYLFSASVYNNIAYGLRLRKTSPAEIRNIVEEALAFVGLENFSQRNAKKLSGGETQRVALARAVALRPQVLFLDEPTANLDPDSVASIEKLIKNVQKTLGTTVIMVTHNLFQARRISDEVIFLYGGELVEKGAVDLVFDQPESELTRRFISGSIVY